MINLNKIVSVIEGYKQYFPEHWEDEKYKWEAVKCFQDNWDITAHDFAKMLKKALSKTFNLLASGYAYPRRMIKLMAETAPDAVKSMFLNLFNENLDLSERIETFINSAEEIRSKYDDGTWKNHYQNTNAISTYLWLMYPDKYYIYKYEIYKKVAELLDDSYRPKGNGEADNVIDGFKMYDEICSVLSEDSELRQMLKSVLTDSCYNDGTLKTLTIDFGFYVARYYNNSDLEKPSKIIEKNKPLNDDEIHYWLFAPGTNASCWEDFYKQEIMGIGWDELGDLREYKSRKEIVEQLRIVNDSDSSFTNDSLAIWQFLYEVKPGDIIFVKKGLHSIIGRGIVKSDFEYRSGQDYFFENIRKVKWTHKGEWEHPGQAVMKTLTDITKYPDYVDKLNQLLGIDEDLALEENAVEVYTKSDFLNDVFLTEPEYDKLRSLVLRKKNIILQGAPGVGKTFSAKRLAYSIIGEKNENRICMVQFHQNYSYEDFIMGYRPNDKGGFELQSGVFYNFCIRCKENPDKPYLFIIDEINRGNLSKTFGELLMLIETDKRGETHKINLVYSGTAFYIPENLHIIGMMNTADRSLAMIDYALRRRFSFYTMQPAFDKADQNGFGDYMENIQCKLYHTVIAKIKELNNVIRKDSTLGKGFEIGHSYFAPENKSDIDDEWVRGVVEYEIIPLIEEYWFDNDKKLDEWTKALYQAIGEENDG